MKRKGFTLVELLTVIAILAVILLIAAPTILNVLEKSKKNNFKNQVLLYVEGLKQEVTMSAINIGSITLPQKGRSVEVSLDKINLDSDKGYTGSILITNNNGNYKYELINVEGDGYIANGNPRNMRITKSKDTSRYISYKIGDSVTLKDNTVWYVIENSYSNSSTVTLFASQNIKNDATGWTTVKDEYKIAFDEANARSTEKNSYCTNPEYGCNIYASNGSTVRDDSTIKKFLDGSVTNYINNSLTSSGGTNINSIRLITVDEICNIINASDSSNNCTLQSAHYWDNGKKKFMEVFNNVPSWLYPTYYWTMTPKISSSSNIYLVTDTGSLGYYDARYDSISYGARPVIVTLKSNIK